MNKFAKRDSCMFIIGVCLLALVFGFMYLSSYIVKLNKPLIEVEENAISSYVTSTYVPFVVAEDENKENCYAIIHDENNVLYLIKDKKSHLNSLYKNDINNKVVFSGTAFKTEDNIIDFTIKGYNLYADEEYLNKDNYSLFFGDYYLDVSIQPLNIILTKSFSFILSLTSVAFITFSIISKINTSNTMNYISDKNDKDTIIYKNIVISKSYLLLYNFGLSHYDYKDIDSYELLDKQKRYYLKIKINNKNKVVYIGKSLDESNKILELIKKYQKKAKEM